MWVSGHILPASCSTACWPYPSRGKDDSVSAGLPAMMDLTLHYPHPSRRHSSLRKESSAEAFVWYKMPLGQPGATQKIDCTPDRLLPSLWEETASGTVMRNFLVNERKSRSARQSILCVAPGCPRGSIVPYKNKENQFHPVLASPGWSKIILKSFQVSFTFLYLSFPFLFIPSFNTKHTVNSNVFFYKLTEGCWYWLLPLTNLLCWQASSLLASHLSPFGWSGDLKKIIVPLGLLVFFKWME